MLYIYLIGVIITSYFVENATNDERICFCLFWPVIAAFFLCCIIAELLKETVDAINIKIKLLIEKLK